MILLSYLFGGKKNQKTKEENAREKESNIQPKEWKFPMQALEMLIGKFLESVQKSPDTCRIMPVQIRFAIPPKDDFIGGLELQSISEDKDKRTLIVSIVERGDDHVYSHYLKSGSKSEMIEYLSSEAGKNEINDSLRELYFDVV